MSEFKCYGSGDVRTAILRFLLVVLVIYALVIIMPLTRNISYWVLGEFDYAIVTHWPFYLVNITLVLMSVPLWRGSRYASFILVIMSVCYIVYSVMRNYWPVTHITYGMVLLIISWLSYCLKEKGSEPF